MAVALASVDTAAADPVDLGEARRGAEVLAEIQELDAQLSHAIESYNLANVKLDRIEAELRTNTRHLTSRARA